MHSTRLAILCALCAGALPATAGPVPPPPAPRSSSVGLRLGFASSSSSTSEHEAGSMMGGVAFGASFVRDFAGRFAVEGSLSASDRGMRQTGTSLEANLLLYLGSRGSRARPYVAGGGGLYRITAPRDGMLQGAMPLVYSGRGDSSLPRDMYRSAVNPDVGVAGGVRLDLGSRLSLRPEARATVVLGDRTAVFGSFTVQAGYRF